jgi:RNA polymerase sigma factor (sigma-70 family)
MDDPALLQRYTATRDESAFTELVQRHLGLVYHTALRRLNGDAHHAHDVSQTVFTLLARKASALTRHPTLTGWLHAAAINTARDLIRAEQRRAAREEETLAMQDKLTSTPSDESWQQLRPVIDDALSDLNAADRDALLLRYFEDRPLTHVATTLRLSEDAARMKVNRALEKLRESLSKRGVTSTAAALATILAPQAYASVSTNLVASISASALTTAAALPAASAISILALKIMTVSKTTACFVVLTFCATVTAIYQTKAHSRAEVALAESRALHGVLQTKIADLETRLTATEGRAKDAERDSELLLKAAESSAPALAAAAAANEPVTRAMVEARYKQARAFMKAGQYEAATKDFLWCFDTGMKKVSSYTGVRSSYVIEMLAEIGKKYPPALAALRERQAAASAALERDRSDPTPLIEISGLNRALGEDARTLALFDSFPPEEKTQRNVLAYIVTDQLLEARRYKDIVQAQPYSRMSQMLAVTANGINSLPESRRPEMRRQVLESAAKNLEALAGAGDTANAKELLTALIAIDSSPETKALIQKHLTRSGNTELFVP